MRLSARTLSGGSIALAAAALVVAAGSLRAQEVYEVTQGGLPQDSYHRLVQYDYDSGNHLWRAYSHYTDNLGLNRYPWIMYYGYDGDKLRYEYAFSGETPGVPNQPTWAYYRLVYYEYGDDDAYYYDDLGNWILPGSQLVRTRNVDLKTGNTLNENYFHYDGNGRLVSVYHYRDQDWGPWTRTGRDEYSYYDDGRALYIDRWGENDQYLGYWGFEYYFGERDASNSFTDIRPDGYLKRKTWFDANWNAVYSKNYRYSGTEFEYIAYGGMAHRAGGGSSEDYQTSFPGAAYDTYTYWDSGQTTSIQASHSTALNYPAALVTTPIKANFNPVDPLNLFNISEAELTSLIEP